MGVQPLIRRIRPWTSITDERRARLASRHRQGSETPQVFAAALEGVSSSLDVRLREAYTFAAGIDYTHPGLTASAYLAHPVRVMALALNLTSPPDGDAGVLSLLHNVYEVSRTSADVVAGRFGQPVADGISVLTVNRADLSEVQVRAYYQALTAAPGFVRLVKVLDKIDNLFLLALNPDPQSRHDYLAEVAAYVTPLAAGVLPEIVPYLHELVEDCRRVGGFTGGMEYS